MIQEIINGKAGYHLKIGSSRYKVELQKPLGSDEGTPVSCKPDFFISPIDSPESLKPIAIFCDGWKYHKDITDEDALKRNALVNSGRYWVWSITYQDVEKAIKKEIATDLQSPLSSHQQRNPFGYSHQTDENVFQLNSMALLVLWLNNDAQERENALKVKQNTAAAALLKMVYDPSNADYIQVKQNLKAQWNSLLTGFPMMKILCLRLVQSEFNRKSPIGGHNNL